MADNELQKRIEELADRAGIKLGDQPETDRPSVGRQTHRSTGGTGGRQQVTGGAVETIGGWPTVQRGMILVIDPRTFCNPPRGANVSMLPMKGGSAYVKGGASWQVWCHQVCQCDKHEADRQETAGDRRTQIIDEQEEG